MANCQSRLQSSKRGSGIGYLAQAFLRPHKRTIAWSLGLMLLQSLLLLPVPWLQGAVLDELMRASTRIVQADQAAFLARLIGLAVGIAVGCHLARTALGWLGSALMSRATLEVVRTLTDTLHRKLQRMPMTYFDRHETGELMARLTNDVGTLMIFLNAGSLQLASDLVLAGGIAVVLFVICWPLALVSIVALPLFVVNHRRFAGRLQELSRQSQARAAGLYALLSERVSGVRTVRAFGQEQAELDRFDRQLSEQSEVAHKSLQLWARQGFAAVLTSALATGVLACLAALLLRADWITLGQAVAFLAYVGLLYLPLVRLTQLYAGASATLAAIDRIAEVLMEPEPAYERRGQRRLARVRGELALRNVSFRYHPRGPLILEGVNLRIVAGMTVGIYGASGSGKSTLLSLIPRIYDLPVGNGRILLDGYDIRNLSTIDLRRSALLVPQHARLFEGTVRFNLTYAEPCADETTLWRALDAVELTELIASMPEGLDTWIGERGASLSGGQRQRVALARALVVNPPILLLDDCTSALDAQTEHRVRRGIESFRSTQTRLIVSHKPEAFWNADWMVVLEQGRIVHQGTPSRLLRDLAPRIA